MSKTRSFIMGKEKAWLLFAAVTLVTLTVPGRGAEPVRPEGNVPTTPVVSASPAKQGGGTTCDACCDPSEHTVRFVTVAQDVQLEVLDWGGTGEPLVLLAGLGDNAHAFDAFAYQFTDKFHVYGITRRGFGRSSQPKNGYDLDTRVGDDIAVLDALNISRANFIGHSIAGTELYRLGAAYPERVKKLVTLDGLDNASGGWANLPQPPPAPELTPVDLQSVQYLAAALARSDGYRKPLAAICNAVQLDSSGRVVGPVTPPDIYKNILAGLKPAEYNRIQAPVLGIFNRPSHQYRVPYYFDLDPATQEEFRRDIKALSKWTAGALRRFRSEVKNARIIELPDSNHYAYVVEEWFFVREIRKFLLEK
jgi:pimeloyl-ACP methyl ester carboxylesterase